jgi:predicted nucleic acid-binding Zn ribbon protein
MAKIYEYKCVSCGDIIESDTNEFVGTHDCEDPPARYKRLYQLGGAVLKGSGWYSVDKRKTDGGTLGID